ncbi:MAG: hypothetical protein MJZ82_05660 [Paludibacteraceae bacterium]|nr:hypothetical protein [Paludibacteraceae bacterium]
MKRIFFSFLLLAVSFFGFAGQKSAMDSLISQYKYGPRYEIVTTSIPQLEVLKIDKCAGRVYMLYAFYNGEKVWRELALTPLGSPREDILASDEINYRLILLGEGDEQTIYLFNFRTGKMWELIYKRGGYMWRSVEDYKDY